MLAYSSSPTWPSFRLTPSCWAYKKPSTVLFDQLKLSNYGKRHGSRKVSSSYTYSSWLLYGASVNIHSLTETALAMTIFRDEGRFIPSSSRAVATSHERRRYTSRRLQFDGQKSSQTMETSLCPMLTLGIASWRLVSLHVHFLINLESLELVGRGSGKQARKSKYSHCPSNGRTRLRFSSSNPRPIRDFFIHDSQPLYLFPFYSMSICSAFAPAVFSNKRGQTWFVDEKPYGIILELLLSVLDGHVCFRIRSPHNPFIIHHGSLCTLPL